MKARRLSARREKESGRADVIGRFAMGMPHEDFDRLARGTDHLLHLPAVASDADREKQHEFDAALRSMTRDQIKNFKAFYNNALCLEGSDTVTIAGMKKLNAKQQFGFEEKELQAAFRKVDYGGSSASILTLRPPIHPSASSPH